MDTIDRGIIWELHENCRISYQALAKKFGLTANGIRGRILKMMEAGIIDRFMVSLSAEMIDADIMFALVYTDGTEDPEEFITKLGQSPMTIFVGLIACTEGGVYHLAAQYIKSEGLNQIGSFIRSNKEVIRLEIYPILYRRGGKAELKKADLRVLKVLVDDARMPIREISEKTGLTARRVKRILDRFSETDCIWTAARWNLVAGGCIQFFMRTIYDERATTADKLAKWLRESFPREYWDTYFVATSPEVFVEFVVDDLRDIEQILRSMKKHQFIKTATPLVRLSESKFPWLCEHYLRKRIAESETSD